MIDISHRQAQRLLRTHLDTQLPNEQWMILQAHLEVCGPCRAYGESLAVLEKSLTRSLHTGWQAIPEPAADLESQILSGLQLRKLQHRRMLVAVVAAAVIIVILLMGGPAGIIRRFSDSSISQVAETETPPASPTAAAAFATIQPTVEPGQFSEVIAYEGRRDGKPNGDAEIYLLNPGSTTVDLTNNPAQDTDPAWSPDGEWIAFLSNRNKKVEVFVTNITGSRVVQLTDDPGVIWQGPLSWSADGKWIALGGTRDQQGYQNWIYLVALDGTGAHALAGSRGGDSPKFSPSGDRVAFHFSEGGQEGIIVQTIESGQQESVKWVDNSLVPTLAPGSAFDWSADGTGLAFVSASLSPVASASSPAMDAPSPSGDPGSQVLAVRDINDPAEPYSYLTDTFHVDSSRWPGAFSGVSWTPGNAVVYLEDLNDARANENPSPSLGCWTMQLSYPILRGNNFPRSARQASFGGLCVDGGVDRSSWTADGQWIVVKGHLPNEEQTSIYAIRMTNGFEQNRRFFRITPTPSDSSGNGDLAVGAILRLSGDPWPGALPTPRPRLDANAALLRIDPHPAQKPAAVLAPSYMRLANQEGQVIFVVQNNTMSLVVSASADGTGGRVLLASPSLNRCPAWSPDRNDIALLQIAGAPPSQTSGAGEIPVTGNFTSNQDQTSAGPTGVQNIYILNASAGSLRQVSQANAGPIDGMQPDQISYGCPVWSPGGASGPRYLAAMVRVGQSAFLAVLPADQTGSTGNATPIQPRYLPVSSPDLSMTPVWSPDGRTIFLLTSPNSSSSPAVTVVSVSSDPQAALTSTTWPPRWLSQTVSGLAVLPDGKAIVELEITGSLRSAHLHRIYLSNTGQATDAGQGVYLQSQPGQGLQRDERVVSGSITWLYGSTFAVILHAGPNEPVKTLFYLYDLNTDRATAMTSSTDAVTDAAWSPDGNWLVFSAESGLWGVDVRGASQRSVSPVWLSPQPVDGLDW